MRSWLRALDRWLRQELDLWFATVARYIGLVMCLYSVFIDKLHTPALLTVAAGLVFMKSVMKGGE